MRCGGQDAAARRRLHGPRGVSPAAAQPQRAGQQHRRHREDLAHDGRGERADQRCR